MREILFYFFAFDAFIRISVVGLDVILFEVFDARWVNLVGLLFFFPSWKRKIESRYGLDGMEWMGWDDGG